MGFHFRSHSSNLMFMPSKSIKRNLMRPIGIELISCSLEIKIGLIQMERRVYVTSDP